MWFWQIWFRMSCNTNMLEQIFFVTITLLAYQPSYISRLLPCSRVSWIWVRTSIANGAVIINSKKKYTPAINQRKTTTSVIIYWKVITSRRKSWLHKSQYLLMNNQGRSTTKIIGEAKVWKKWPPWLADGENFRFWMA